MVEGERCIDSSAISALLSIDLDTVVVNLLFRGHFLSASKVQHIQFSLPGIDYRYISLL